MSGLHEGLDATFDFNSGESALGEYKLRMIHEGAHGKPQQPLGSMNTSLSLTIGSGRAKSRLNGMSLALTRSLDADERQLPGAKPPRALGSGSEETGHSQGEGPRPCYRRWEQRD